MPGVVVKGVGGLIPIISCIDDLYIIGPPAKPQSSFELIAETWQKLGLSLNRSKTYVWRNKVSTEAIPEEGQPSVRDTIK
eukprot:12486119-Prorocentrum_lima.AAC.1